MRQFYGFKIGGRSYGFNKGGASSGGYNKGEEENDDKGRCSCTSEISELRSELQKLRREFVEFKKSDFKGPPGPRVSNKRATSISPTYTSTHDD